MVSLGVFKINFMYGPVHCIELLDHVYVHFHTTMDCGYILCNIMRDDKVWEHNIICMNFWN